MGQREAQSAFADRLVHRPPGPVAGQFHHDASGALHDHGGDLDQHQPPGAGLADTQHLGQMLIIPDGVEQIEGGGVKQQAKEVGHEAVTAQPIHAQAVLQFIHALFALAALDVVVVLPLAVIG